MPLIISQQLCQNSFVTYVSFMTILLDDMFKVEHYDPFNYWRNKRYDVDQELVSLHALSLNPNIIMTADLTNDRIKIEDSLARSHYLSRHNGDYVSLQINSLRGHLFGEICFIGENYFIDTQSFVGYPPCCHYKTFFVPKNIAREIFSLTS